MSNRRRNDGGAQAPDARPNWKEQSTRESLTGKQWRYALLARITEDDVKRLLIFVGVAMLSCAARADNLPNEFMGEWFVDKFNTYTIHPSSIEGPGFQCRFTSIKPKDSNPGADNNERTWIVDMICSLEDAPRQERWRQLWAMRRAGSASFFVLVDETNPRIDILVRP